MTRAVRNTLLRALDLADCFGAGIYPGKGQGPHFRRLVAKGLLRFEGHGTAIDGKDGEVPVYALTIAGRAAAQEACR